MTGVALRADRTIRNDFVFERALEGAIDTLMTLRGAATTELLLVQNAEPDYAVSAPKI